MNTVFRATNVDEVPRIISFLAKAFSVNENVEFLRPDLLYWKLWAPRDDCARPRSYVLERGDEIIAHTGVWPASLQTDAGTLEGCHMFDWAAYPRGLGSGTLMVRKLSDVFDFIYGCGGTEQTRKMTPELGFQKIGDAWLGSLPLHPLRRMFSDRQWDWKAPARFLRDTVRTAASSYVPSAEWEIQEGLSENEIRPSCGAPVVLRPNGFFRYLQKCPTAQIRVFELTKQRRHVGRIAMSFRHHQARIAGIWLNEPSQEALCSAYALALRATRRMHSVFEAIVVGSTPSIRCAAESAGFRDVRQTPIYWLPGKNKVRPIPFEFQLADNDEIFL